MQKISQFLVLLTAFITNTGFSQNINNNKKTLFSPPLDIPLLLSGNYAEIRSTAFHAGIDIKTQQVEGKNVLAADDGYISRIAIQSGSYGKAVYMKHPGGLVTVYGHFSSFAPELEKYVTDQQYLKKSFTVDLYPEPGRFTFKKGELIGLSGNTGNSGGPHLHFEIRDESSTIPLNVLNYELPITDNIPPTIGWLAVYPVDRQNKIIGGNNELLIKTEGTGNRFTVSPAVIPVNGNIAFGIESYDYLNNSANSCTPYTIELLLDNKQIYFCRFDSIPFSMMNYVKSHIDYGEKVKSGKVIHRLFVEPNNRLKIYKVAVNRGIISITDTRVHNVLINVTDTYGNRSVLQFDIRNTGEVNTQFKDEQRNNVVSKFTYSASNSFENDSVRIMIPANALFDDLDFMYRHIPDSNNIKDIYQIHNEYIPLLNSYILSIKPFNVPTSLLNKSYIAILGNDNTSSSQGGEYHNGYITTQTRLFGKFYLATDTISPAINPLRFRNNSTYSEGDTISFKITDDQTGVRSYNGYIDNQWSLFEYDGKNDLLFYKIDGERLQHNVLHSLEVIVTDNKDNVNRYTGSFRF